MSAGRRRKPKEEEQAARRYGAEHLQLVGDEMTKQKEAESCDKAISQVVHGWGVKPTEKDMWEMQAEFYWSKLALMSSSGFLDGWSVD